MRVKIYGTLTIKYTCSKCFACINPHTNLDIGIIIIFTLQERKLRLSCKLRQRD